MLGKVAHIIGDPPYEATLHKAKAGLVGRKHRNDGVAELKGLDFAPIDGIRGDVVRLAADICEGWFIAFCTPEGVAIRRYAITAALWLAWIVLAPVDRLINAHQRQKQIHRDRVKRAGVGGGAAHGPSATSISE